MQRRPQPAFRCHACGYDLRGSVAARCPECGARWRDAPPFVSNGEIVVTLVAAVVGIAVVSLVWLHLAHEASVAVSFVGWLVATFGSGGLEGRALFAAMLGAGFLLVSLPSWVGRARVHPVTYITVIVLGAMNLLLVAYAAAVAGDVPTRTPRVFVVTAWSLALVGPALASWWWWRPGPPSYRRAVFQRAVLYAWVVLGTMPTTGSISQ